jgi:hypothetical protein
MMLRHPVREHDIVIHSMMTFVYRRLSERGQGCTQQSNHHGARVFESHRLTSAVDAANFMPRKRFAMMTLSTPA